MRKRRTISARSRMRTALHRRHLTRALAEGASCEASDELTLRADQLTSEHHRSVLARSLRRTVTEVIQPVRLPGPAVRAERAAVREAADAITELIRRLESPRPVHPQGMALSEQIITSADSPLYNRTAPGTLRRAVRAATVALDRQTVSSHEFDLAV